MNWALTVLGRSQAESIKFAGDGPATFGTRGEAGGGGAMADRIGFAFGTG
jgi:hypothetical protein